MNTEQVAPRSRSRVPRLHVYYAGISFCMPFLDGVDFRRNIVVFTY
jgi:hypothetical protein